MDENQGMEVMTKTESEFRTAIEGVINTHCMENGSNTPDFVLAEYLLSCLRAFDLATLQRSMFYSMHHQAAGDPLTSDVEIEDLIEIRMDTP